MIKNSIWESLYGQGRNCASVRLWRHKLSAQIFWRFFALTLFSALRSAKISMVVIVTGGAALMPNEMTFIPEMHESNPIITIRFKYNPLLIEEVKKLPGRKWSQTLKCWYVPDTREYRARFGLPLKLSSKRKLGNVLPVNQPALDALRETLILKGYSKNTQRTYYYEFAQLLYALGDKDVKEKTRFVKVVFQ
jgi:hypothetical protein